MRKPLGLSSPFRAASLAAFLCALSAVLAPAPAPAGIVPSGTVQLPLTAGNGSGRVTSAPAGIDCTYTRDVRSGICTYVFTSSSLEPVDVVLTYTPSPGNLLSRGGSTQAGPASTTITIADLGLTYSPPEDWTFVITTPLVTVMTSGAGGGRVVSAPLGIDCGSLCSQRFDYGTQVNLVATPAAGSAFSSWTGACAGQPATCTLTLTADTVAGAVFDLAFGSIPGVAVTDGSVDVDRPVSWRWLHRADHQARQPRILELRLNAREPVSATLKLRRARVVIARKTFRALPIGASALRLGVRADETGSAILEGTLADRSGNRLLIRCRVRIPTVLNAGLSLRRCSTKAAVQARVALASAGGPDASALLAHTQECTRLSKGLYRTDLERRRTIAVCDAGDAVWWRADMDVDCDGKPTPRCNLRTDPAFQPATAFQQSNGRQLVADRSHYIVVPSASRTWNHVRSGLRGGGSCAVVYEDRVLYAVIGDTGPKGIIGEASYATARDLGIDPDPATGGSDGPVTYICFKGSRVSPIESNARAAEVGAALATAFVESG